MMRRILVKLNEKGLQPALPLDVCCLKILDAEVRKGILRVIVEVPDNDKEGK